MKPLDPTKIWILGQDTSKGFRYYTNTASPISPDGWSPDIRKAHRFTWPQAINMREYASAYTSGAPVQRVRHG